MGGKSRYWDRKTRTILELPWGLVRQSLKKLDKVTSQWTSPDGESIGVVCVACQVAGNCRKLGALTPGSAGWV